MPLGKGVAAVRALGEIVPGTPASARVVAALSRALESKSKGTRLAALMALDPIRAGRCRGPSSTFARAATLTLSPKSAAQPPGL